MVKLAIRDIPHFRINLYEAETEEHSYTYSTLKEFSKRYPDDEFYFILGADSLFAIEEWKNFREIFPFCTILAAMRDDKDVQRMHLQIDYLSESYGAKIELLRAPLVEISSTTVRRRASLNLSVRYMVPDTVAEYIKDHQLYKKRG